MTVDSFKFLPRIIATFYQQQKIVARLPIPWTPLTKPLSKCRFGLVCSGGLYHKGIEPSFDMEREQVDPTWGDPSYRTIPINIQQDELGVSHLHINPSAALEDINVMLPLTRFSELAQQGVIGNIAQNAFSFMGYQGFPPTTEAWENVYGPQVAKKLQEEGVDCVMLIPA